MQTLKLVSPGSPLERLADFDLTVDDVHQRVLGAALSAKTNTNPLAMRSAPGTNAHGAALEGLRSIVCPKGWELDQKDGVPRTVHRARRLAIVVATGNELTGFEQETLRVTTKWPKGPAAFNRAEMFDDEGFESVDPTGNSWGQKRDDSVEEWTLWYLLFHIEGKSVRAELSQPSYLNGSNFPQGWLNRIIIPPYAIEESASIGNAADAAPDNDLRPDVPVEEI